MAENFLRRDFLKVASLGVGALALKKPIEMLRKLAKETLPVEQRLSVFLPRLGEMGMAVVFDKTTGLSSIFSCQPEIGVDPNNLTKNALYLTHASLTRTEIAANRDGVYAGLPYVELKRERRKDVKNRTESHTGEEIVNGYVDGYIWITPDMLAKGKFGTEEYKKDFIAEENRIKNLPKKFKKQGYEPNFEVDKDGNIVKGAWAEVLITTNDQTGAAEIAIQYFVEVIKKVTTVDGEIKKYKDKQLIGQNGVAKRINPSQTSSSVAGGGSKP